MENCCRHVFLRWRAVDSKTRTTTKTGFFPILSIARARTNAILAGKCGSRRQSTTSFSSMNVVVVKTSLQMLEILLFSDRERT